MQYIHDDSFLTLVGSFSSVFGGLRFVWSFLVDYKQSFKFSYLILLVIQTIFGATFVLVKHIKALFFIWVCMIVWCEGGHFSLVPTACANLFGKHAAIVYGFAFSFGSFSQILSSVLVTFFLNDIGYETFYYVSAGLSAAALLMLIFVFKEEKFC